MDDHTGPGGVISLRCSGKSHFRLNPRTRSVDVLEEEEEDEEEEGPVRAYRRHSVLHQEKRSSLRLPTPASAASVDCNDEKVHESILVASKSSSYSRLRSTSLQKLRRRSRKNPALLRTKTRQNSLDSCETIESELYSVFNEFGDYSSPRSESPETRPVERAVEARAGSEDGLGSMVRCLHFAETYIVNRKFLSSI